jgi:hypothetical protein
MSISEESFTTLTEDEFRGQIVVTEVVVFLNQAEPFIESLLDPLVPKGRGLGGYLHGERESVSQDGWGLVMFYQHSYQLEDIFPSHRDDGREAEV